MHINKHRHTDRNIEKNLEYDLKFIKKIDMGPCGLRIGTNQYILAF